VQHAAIVSIEVEDGRRWRAVEEVEPAAPALADQAEAAHAVASEACQVIVTFVQRETEQIDEALVLTSEMATQAE
jgi:hypothetical protein